MDNILENKSNKKIFRGSILSYISLILGILSGILFTPWIIKTIGEGPYGIYALSISIVNLFMVDFGLSATTNTFLAKLRAKGDEEGIRRVLGIIYKLYLLISLFILVVFIVTFFSIDALYKGLTFSERSDLKNAFIIIGLFSAISFPCTIFSGILNSYEKFSAVKIADIIHKLLFIGLTVLSIVFKLGLYALILANVSSALFAYVIKYLIIRKKMKIKADFKYKFTFKDVKPLLLFSIWAAVSSVASRLIFNITPSILGIVSDSTNITLFSVASTIEGYFYSFGSAIGGLFLPKIARIIENNDEDFRHKLNVLSIKVGKIQFLIVCLLYSGFCACGHDFVNLWLGKDAVFDVVYWNIIMLASFQLIYSTQTILWYAMLITNKVAYLALSETIAAIFNVGLAFLFSYFWGSFGACLSICVSRFLSIVLQNIFYCKFLKFNFWDFFTKVTLKGSIGMVISFACAFTFSSLAPIDNTLIKFIIEILILILSFVISQTFIYADKNERQFILSIFRRNNGEVFPNG